LKRTILYLVSASILFVACRKENIILQEAACLPQTDNPAGRSYAENMLASVSYSQKHCGLLPLSKKNYWVYIDSFFTNGAFARSKYDTLRFTTTYQSMPDQLIWWQPDMEIGLPDLLYSNDSAIFLASYRLFAPDPIRDAKKEYGLFAGDSVKYLTSFDDNAALGRSVKWSSTITTPAGNFGNCILFEKKAPYFRKDQVFFKPGLGVVKYIHEEAPMGSPVMELQKTSTLVSAHIE
jgi:hypothetical protein